MRRYAARKDGNQSEVVSALRAAGCDVWVMHTPCDLLVGRAGVNYLLEVKNGTKTHRARTLTPEQVKFRAAWRGHFAVVPDTDAALAAVGVIAVPPAGCYGATDAEGVSG